VFADAKADIAAGAVGLVEILVRGDIVVSGAVKVGAAADEQGQLGGDGLEHIATRSARAGKFGVGREDRDFLKQVGKTGLHAARGKKRRLVRIGRAPRIVNFRPFLINAREAFPLAGEMGMHIVAHIEMLVGGQPKTGACLVNELGPTLTVRLGCAGNLRNAAADLGFGNDELGLSGFGFFGFIVGL
jgi:hypothetical protein